MNLTRRQLVEICGLKAVRMLENVECDFTNRLLDLDGQMHVELIASLELDNGDLISAYYYQPEKLIRVTEELSDLKWVIDHYEIE